MMPQTLFACRRVPLITINVNLFFAPFTLVRTGFNIVRVARSFGDNFKTVFGQHPEALAADASNKIRRFQYAARETPSRDADNGLGGITFPCTNDIVVRRWAKSVLHPLIKCLTGLKQVLACNASGIPSPISC